MAFCLRRPQGVGCAILTEKDFYLRRNIGANIARRGAIAIYRDPADFLAHYDELMDLCLIPSQFFVSD